MIRALDWFGDQQLLEVQAGGVRNRYQRLRPADDPQALAADLVSYNMKREAAETARLQQVLDLFNLDGCRAAALAAHFGEELETPCGHCSGCRGEVVTIKPRSEGAIEDGLWIRVHPTVEAAGEVLGTPRAVARFLCGLTSPRMTRARLARDPLFGVLAEMPFPKVLAWAQQQLGAGP